MLGLFSVSLLQLWVWWSFCSFILQTLNQTSDFGRRGCAQPPGLRVDALYRLPSSLLADWGGNSSWRRNEEQTAIPTLTPPNSGSLWSVERQDCVSSSSSGSWARCVYTCMSSHHVSVDLTLLLCCFSIFFTRIPMRGAILWKWCTVVFCGVLINIISFFWDIWWFFLAEKTLAAHYFPIISTFVLDAEWSGCCSISWPAGGSSSLNSWCRTDCFFDFYSDYFHGWWYFGLVLWSDAFLHKFGIWCLL